jgi:hypothetical protein
MEKNKKIDFKKNGIMYLKLVSGELLLAYTDLETLKEGSKMVMVHHPYSVNFGSTEMGTMIRILEWIPSANGYTFTINKDHILQILDPEKKLRQYYIEYLDDILEERAYEETNKIDLSDKKGITAASFNYSSNNTIH